MEDSCPSTPLHVLPGRNSKSPNQMVVSSPDSDGIKSPNSRLSPDSRCVICLGKLQKKSFTDSCLHQFCFQCLLQWSKVKPECPLCKQPFKSIIHNVRSNCDYDQYHIERREPAYVVSEILHSYDFDLVPVDHRFRYRSTMTSEYFRELAESFLTRTRTPYQISSLPAYHILPSNGLPRTRSERVRQRGVSDFRRTIYEQDLWVQDLADVTGRHRECSPQFYRDNPAQIHRIVPWLNREINALINGNESRSAYILGRITSLITQYSIRSHEFREAVEVYFGRRTDHFIHEFYTFARSVYDIAGFDHEAVYVPNPNYSNEVQEISSNDDSEVEVIWTLQQKNPQSSNCDCPHRKTSKNVNQSTLNSNEPVAGPSGINNCRITETIEVCESDQDDIKVIEYVKPEPEIVTLSSGDEQPISNTHRRSGSFSGKIYPKKSSGESLSESRISSNEHISRHRHKRAKRCKSISGKYKTNPDGFGLKGRQKKNYIRSREERSCSSCSCSSCSSSDSSSSNENLSVSSICSNSSHSDQARPDSSDYEQSSKLRKKKRVSNSRGHRKKTKKSAIHLIRHRSRDDRSGLVESIPSISNDQSKKKRRVKSCVIIPNSQGKRSKSESHEDASECSRNSNTSSTYSDNRINTTSSSPSLPTYWSLVLNNKSERSKKRKRSKEGKHTSSSSKRNKEGVANSSERSESCGRVTSSSAKNSSGPENSSKDFYVDFTGSVLENLKHPKSSSTSANEDNAIELVG